MKDQESPSAPQEVAKIESAKPIPKGRKVTVTKASVKRYRVIVTHVRVTEEEEKIKRAIIEDIMKKGTSTN